jgi:hypothetical protein
VRQIFTLRDKRSGLKQLPIEITNEQIGQELDMWFNNEACEALARESGFIQRSTSRLTGSAFFNLLTVEALDEPTISYEGCATALKNAIQTCR